MTRQIVLTDAQEIWLAEQHSNLTHQELAGELGCCIDTLKRMLMKRGLQYFPGAKYQFKEAPKVWKRPCSSCGCDKARPKFQYRCDACHEREENDHSFFECGSYQTAYRITNTDAFMFTLKGDWYGQSPESQRRQIRSRPI